MPEPTSTASPLTEEQIEAIAEKAADKAVAKLTDHVYREVGRGVISKFLWICGATAAAAFLWAKSKGWIS